MTTQRNKREKDLQAKAAQNVELTEDQKETIEDNDSAQEYNQELIDRQVAEIEQADKESLENEQALENRVGQLEEILKQIVEDISESTESELSSETIPLENDYVFAQMFIGFISTRSAEFANKAQNRESTDELIDWGISQTVRARKKISELET